DTWITLNSPVDWRWENPEEIVAYDSTGDNQVLALSVDRTQEAKYRINIQNDGNAPDTYTISGNSSADLPSGWTVSYYSDAVFSADVTSDVIANTYNISTLGKGVDFETDNGGTAALYVKIIPGNTVYGNTTSQVRVVVQSGSLTSKKDAVRLDTTCNQAYQTDAIFDDNTGDGIYESPATAAQRKIQTVDNGQTVTYYVRIQNEGNTNLSFTITATGSDANWTITYYDVTGGGGIISESTITPTGWTSNVVNGPGSNYQEIRVEIGCALTATASTKDIRITATDSASGTSDDQVWIQLDLPNTYKLDGMIRLVTGEDDSNYATSDGVYEDYNPPATPAVQSKGQSVFNSVVASYYFKIENDGNAADNITVSGTGDATNWTFAYYNVTDVVDVTAEVKAGTFSKTLNPFGVDNWVIRVDVTPGAGATPGTSFNSYITVYGASGNEDSVRCMTTVSSDELPDLMIKNDGEADSAYV
ncbi:MAG: hypothetical protein KAI63_01100, partial [Planctomycetes bacterium]|nr:hypothetical protein [Planctomycetota bacterium]